MRRSAAAITVRRTFAVLAMLLGAAVGAFLILNAGLAWALGIALPLLGSVVAIASAQSRQAAAWHVHGS